MTTDHDQDLANARGQADLTGAVTLEEARAAHARLIQEAARLDLGADVMESMTKVAKFLEAIN